MAWMIIGTQETAKGLVKVVDRGYKSWQGAKNETRSGEWVSAEVVEESAVMVAV